MHKKRTEMPNTWPIARKVRKHRFIAQPTHDAANSITILAVLRDILKFATTRKEVKFILNNGELKINNKLRKDDTYPVSAFDTISFEKLNKYYRLEIVNKKFTLKEISKKEASFKTVKISGKKVLSNNKTQLNLEDGNNFIVDIEFNVGDSVVLNTSDNKIEKVLPLRKGAKVEVISGKHAGKSGEILSIDEMRRGRQYKIKFEDSEVFLPHKTFFVIN